MRASFVLIIRRVASSPLVAFLSALFMLVSALEELAESLLGEELTALGLEHGVLVFALWSCAKALFELLEGAERLVEAQEALAERARSGSRRSEGRA